MKRFEALILCDQVVRAPDNKVQLQGLFDRIQTAALPAAHRIAWLYFKFYAEPPREKRVIVVRFTLTRPGQIIERLPEMKMQLPLDGRIEGQVALANLPLHSAGQHLFTLYADGEQIASCGFTVDLISTPQPRIQNDSIN